VQLDYAPLIWDERVASIRTKILNSWIFFYFFIFAMDDDDEIYSRLAKTLAGNQENYSR
jgi:hypothetical protein